MSTETGSSPLLELPGEMHNKIMDHLDPMDLLMLRSTCRYFRNIIPPLSMDDLLDAELGTTGRQRDLYACCLCLRLRHASHFADPMKSGPKRKIAGVGAKRSSRFCVECGVNPPPRRNGYGRGALITRNGVGFVKCMRCNQLATPGQYPNGDFTKWCTRCWPTTPEWREVQQEMRRVEAARLQREQEQRQRKLQEREERRRRRRELWGSDAEDTDEDIGGGADSDDEYYYY